jgi:ribosomal protein S11
MGLSQEALQAVLDAGGESGAAIAAELIKGGSTAILETNALVESSQIAAAIIGQQAAKQWYGAGVSNAQSYLQGVEAAFAEAQKRLAKKGLKIADVKGISASFNDALAGPSVTPISTAPTPGAGGIDRGIMINITGGISTSAEIGESVVNAIRAYNRAAGPANIQVG